MTTKKKPHETPPERPTKKMAAEAFLDRPLIDTAEKAAELVVSAPVAKEFRRDEEAPAKPIVIGPQGRACRVDGFIHAENACPVCGTIEGNP